MSNSNNSQEQVFLTYKKTRTKQKPNRLYVDYNLSDEDRQSNLYKGYVAIEDKRLQDKRRSYLIHQEENYKNNGTPFPEWAQKELHYLRTIKQLNNLRYKWGNWANIAAKRKRKDNGPESLITILEQLAHNNQERKGQPPRIVSGEEHVRGLLDMMLWDKTVYEAFKKMEKEMNQVINIQQYINDHTINLDEEKEEQNQIN